MPTKRTKDRPRFLSPCVADRYTTGRERIAEFSFGALGGGLINLYVTADGKPRVHVYNTDPGIEVLGPPPAPAEAQPVAAPVLPAVLAALREGYLYALRSPINAHRIQNQSALCQMRDALAVAEGRTEEETQAFYEALALEGRPRT